MNVIQYVRKDGESTHGAGKYIRIDNPLDSHVIVDDFVSTGCTIQRIYDALRVTDKDIIPDLLVSGFLDYSYIIKDYKFGTLYAGSFSERLIKQECDQKRMFTEELLTGL